MVSALGLAGWLRADWLGLNPARLIWFSSTCPSSAFWAQRASQVRCCHGDFRSGRVLGRNGKVLESRQAQNRHITSALFHWPNKSHSWLKRCWKVMWQMDGYREGWRIGVNNAIYNSKQGRTGPWRPDHLYLLLSLRRHHFWLDALWMWSFQVSVSHWQLRLR